MTHRAPRILVVGYNAWDVTVSLAEAPRTDTKLEVPPILMGGGGPGATAAVALTRLGAEVRLLTPLTDDPAGRQQAAELVAAGVDISLCPVAAGCRSPMAVILVDPGSGERTILWSRGEVPRLTPLPDPATTLAGWDLLYVDGHEPDASLSLAAAARDSGLPVVMDAGSVRIGTADLVAACTDVVGSRIFVPALTGTDDPAAGLRALRDRGPGRVAMTCGGAGLVALVGDSCVGLPAFDVPVVDTTGAGDVFHAGYAFALASGEDFLGCLRWGAATAALKCRDWGGRRGLPDADEVRRLLAGGRLRPPGPPVDRYPAA